MSKSTQEITKLEGDELVVKSKVMEGDIVSKPSKTCITTLINTEKGQELVVKVANMDGGSGGGGGSTVVVDQTYDPTSTNAQSGTAVAAAVAPALKNTATGTDALTINGTATNVSDSINIGVGSTVRNVCSVVIGKSASAGERNCVVVGHSAESTYGHQGCVAVGQYAKAKADYAIAIGRAVSATASRAIQIGTQTDGVAAENNVANTLRVFEFQLLDGNTGKIPADRLGTGFDATKTQVLKNVNGTLTWVDEA